MSDAALSPEREAVEDVEWDLEGLLNGSTIDELLAEADQIVARLETYRGRIGELDAPGLGS